MWSVSTGLRFGAIATLLLLCPLPAGAQWVSGGTPVTSEPGDQAFPVAVADGQGGSIIAWQEFARIRAQRLDAAGRARAGWPAAGGLEVCPGGPWSPYSQSSPRIAGDGEGGAFVVWHDERQGGCTHLCHDDAKVLYVQRIAGNGAIAGGWPVEGLPVGSTARYQLFAAGGDRGRPTDFNTVVVPDDMGGVIVAWQEGPDLYGVDSQMGIHAQRVAPDGTLRWGPRGALVCAETGDTTYQFPQQLYPWAVADGSGGAFILWQDARSGTGSIIHGQHVSAGGTPSWTPGGVPVSRELRPGQERVTAAADGFGGVYAAWQVGPADSADIDAQRIGAGGNLLWPNDAAVSRASGGQVTPGLIAKGSLGAWIVWTDTRSGTGTDIFVQRLTSEGRVFPGWPEDGAAVGGGAAAMRTHGSLASDEQEGVFCAWMEAALPRAARLTATGGLAEGWPAGGAHLSDAPFNSDQLGLIADGRGGAVVAWQAVNMVTSYDQILAQGLVAEGIADSTAGGGPGGGPALSLLGLRPNPATRNLSVVFTLADQSPARIDLLDLAGRMILTHPVDDPAFGRRLVNLGTTDGLASGMYVIRLTQGGRSVSTRAVVIR